MYMPRPMMTELIKLRDEAEHLLAVYTEYKDSTDQDQRRKAHLILDRFLMTHREEATILMIDSLDVEIHKMIEKTKPKKKGNLLSRLVHSIIPKYNA